MIAARRAVAIARLALRSCAFGLHKCVPFRERVGGRRDGDFVQDPVHENAEFGAACRMVLVESTVWIDLLRKRQTTAVARLRKLLELGEAAAAPVIMQEVVQGASNARAFAALHRYFAGLPLLGRDHAVELHVAAAELYARARWRAVTPRSPHDCLIAATALFADVPLLHDDRDFERLAGVEPRLKLV